MRLVLSAFALGMLASCVSHPTFHAAGVSVATRDLDASRCEAEALRQFPIEQSLRQRAPRFVPPRTTCDAAGTCVATAAYWQPGEFYTTDPNLAARNRAVPACMGARGYTLVDLPACDTRTPIAAPTIMPPLGTESCAVARRGTSPLIVTP